jgi:hypothetical protein
MLASMKRAWCFGNSFNSGTDKFTSSQPVPAFVGISGSDRETRVCDWPYSSFHRYVKDGLLPADWGGDMAEIQGRFGE